MALPIPASGLAVVTPRLWSLRLFFQQPGGIVDQAIHLDGVWTRDQPIFTAVPLTPLASIDWDGGKQIRVYYLDDQYIVQEYCFTQGKGWYPGKIGQMKAKASPLSRLGAIVYNDHEGPHLRVYYQEDKTHIISELCYDAKWHVGEMKIKDAIQGSGLSAVTYAGDGFVQIRVYYQAADHSLKEYCHNNKGWFTGKFTRGFNPGKAPPQTLIAAVAADNAQIQVFWRDGDIVHSKHTSKWEPTVVIKEAGPGFGFTVAQWEAGKRLRIYFEEYNYLLQEIYSDDGGNTWHRGWQLTAQ